MVILSRRERQNFLHFFYFFILHEQKGPGISSIIARRGFSLLLDMPPVFFSVPPLYPKPLLPTIFDIFFCAIVNGR